MRRAAILLAALTLTIVAAGCATNPKKTVLNLDTTDRKWTSRECVEARRAVAHYHDGDRTRAIVAFAGDHAAPFAGTGAALLMSRHQDKRRSELNRWIKHACISHHHGWL